MRIITIVLTDLINDKLKHEEQLQRLINSTDNVNDCVNEIKHTLREITLLEEMINKWRTYTAVDENNVGNNK